MEEKEEQGNQPDNPVQSDDIREDRESIPQQMQQQQPDIQYFIPPPINYLNNKYYQHFQDSENFMHQLTDKFVCLGEELSLSQTPAEVPTERPISLKLKEELSQRNKQIFITMQRILANQSRLTSEESLNGLQEQLKVKMRQFLEICLRAKVAELRYLVLKKIESETVSIVKRTKELKNQLQQIKGELSAHHLSLKNQ